MKTLVRVALFLLNLLETNAGKKSGYQGWNLLVRHFVHPTFVNQLLRYKSIVFRLQKLESCQLLSSLHLYSTCWLLASISTTTSSSRIQVHGGKIPILKWKKAFRLHTI